MAWGSILHEPRYSRDPSKPPTVCAYGHDVAVRQAVLAIQHGLVRDEQAGRLSPLRLRAEQATLDYSVAPWQQGATLEHILASPPFGPCRCEQPKIDSEPALKAFYFLYIVRV